MALLGLAQCPLLCMGLFTGKFESVVEAHYPFYKEVSENPSLLSIMEVLESIRVFNEHINILEKTANQYKYWRDNGVTVEEEKAIIALENREQVALKKNSEILGFLNA